MGRRRKGLSGATEGEVRERESETEEGINPSPHITGVGRPLTPHCLFGFGPISNKAREQSSISATIGNKSHFRLNHPSGVVVSTA
jgi:hypothetical protein